MEPLPDDLETGAEVKPLPDDLEIGPIGVGGVGRGNEVPFGEGFGVGVGDG